MRVFLHLFAVHRQLTATQAVKSTPARHKVNCPKSKRGSPGGHPCRATFLRVITDSSYRLHLSIGFIVGCGKVNCGNAAREGALRYDLGAPFVNHLHTRNRRGAQCAPKNRLILRCVGAQCAPLRGNVYQSFDTVYMIENRKRADPTGHPFSLSKKQHFNSCALCDSTHKIEFAEQIHKFRERVPRNLYKGRKNVPARRGFSSEFDRKRGFDREAARKTLVFRQPQRADPSGQPFSLSCCFVCRYLMMFSHQRCMIAAISARVAVPVGTRRLPFLPFSTPAPTAHCRAGIAYSLAC